jgi:hypothetical protein
MPNKDGRGYLTLNISGQIHHGDIDGWDKLIILDVVFRVQR